MSPQHDNEYAKALVTIKKLEKKIYKQERLIYTLEMILIGYRGVLGLEKVELPKKGEADEHI